MSRNSRLNQYYLAIGSVVCEVRAETPVYAEMLAMAYSTSIIAQDLVGNAELVFTIVEGEREEKIDLTDTIRVRDVVGGYKIDTDPILCSLKLEDKAKAYADFIVYEPEMEDNYLSYHLYVIVNRILLFLDMLVVHAAAIEWKGKVNLFCGHKGAGKSTLSLFLAQSGATILAEDRVILRKKENAYWVSGCSSMMKVMAKTEAFLLPNGLNVEASLVSGIPKKVFDASSRFSMKPHQDYQPTRLFFNQIQEQFNCRKISGNEALLNMVDRTGNMYRFGKHHDYAAFFNFIAQFIQHISHCYALDLSTDLNSLPQLLETLDVLDQDMTQ